MCLTFSLLLKSAPCIDVGIILSLCIYIPQNGIGLFNVLVRAGLLIVMHLEVVHAHILRL